MRRALLAVVALLAPAGIPAQVDYDRAGLAGGPVISGLEDPPRRRPIFIEERVARALADFEARHGKAEKVFRRGDGFPRAIHGFRAMISPAATVIDPSGMDPSAARALSFVEGEREALGLAPEDEFLESSVHALEDLTVVRLEQRRAGLPVLGGGITVHIDRGGAVCAALSSLRRDVPELPSPAIGVDEAVAAATARFEDTGNGPVSRLVSSRAAIARIGTRYRTIWDLHLATPLGPYRVLVDALSGEAIGSGSLLGSVDCSPKPEGLVYAESPVHGAPARVTLEDLACTSDRLLGDFVRSFDWAGTDIFGDPVPELGMRGALVENRMVFEAATGIELAQVGVYHHATGFHEWIGELGFHGLDRPLPAIVNAGECYGEVPCRNAFYNPLYQHSTGFGVLVFGVSPEVNFGLEADVACHEYTHAVVNGTSQLGMDYFDPGAFYSLGLNEAFADYFSSSYMGDPLVGEYIGRVIGRPSLRSLDNSLEWPEDIDPNSFHDTGQIWSGALWDARQALSAGGTDPARILRFDRVVYAALVSLSSNAGFVDAADALLVAAASSGLSSEEVSGIQDILVARGLRSADAEPPPQILRYIPGTEIDGQVTPAAPGSVRLGTVQYEIIVPAHALSLRVEIEGSGNIDLHARHGAPVVLRGDQIESTIASEGPGGSELLNLVQENGLLPGSWYVAVLNRDSQVSDYVLEAELSTSSFERIIPLPPGARVDGSVAGGDSLSPVAYSIPILPGEVDGRKLVLSLEVTGEAELYLRRGLAPEMGLEGQIVADARMRSPAGGGTLTLHSGSIPALEPVTYHAAVWNATAGAIAYSLGAELEDFTAPPLEEVRLAPGTPATDIVPAASPGTRTLHATQYTILVPDDGSRLVVDAKGSGDLGLFLRRGSRVALEDGSLLHDHGSDLPGSGDERVAIDLFSRPRLEGGLYYMAVVSRDTNPSMFEIEADFESAPASATVQELPPLTFTDTVAEPAGADEAGKLSAVQFRIEVDASSRGLDVVTNPFSAGNVDLYLRRTRPVQMIAGRVVADYHAETATSSETITILPPDLIPGTYHAALVNRSPAAITLEIFTLHEAARPGTILVEENSVLFGSVSRPSPGFDCAVGLVQYAVTVPANALQLDFDVRLLTPGPIELLSRFGSRITIDQGQTLQDRSIRIKEDGGIRFSGAELRPGTYFFAGVNCTTERQEFEVRRYLQMAGDPEENIPNDVAEAGTAEPAIGEGTALHPTQYFFDVSLDTREAVMSVLGPGCGDSGLDLLVNPGSRITLAPDGATNARWRTSVRGPAETLLLSSGSGIDHGRYYIALVNGTPEPGPFTLLATRTRGRSLELESGSSASGVIGTAGQPGVGVLQGDQYRIEVPAGSAALRLAVRPTRLATADIDLHARLGAPVRVVANELVADWTSTENGGAEEIRLAAGTHCLGGMYYVAVSNLSLETVEYTLSAELDGSPVAAIPGDSDETGDLTITDAIKTLNYLFVGGPDVCQEAADVDGDGSLNITDPVNLLGYLFLGREPPRAPFPDCGLLEDAGSCTGAACE